MSQLILSPIVDSGGRSISCPAKIVKFLHMQYSHSIFINKQGMCFKLCSLYTYWIALTLAQKNILDRVSVHT